jgi:hypothetical protein
LEIEPLFQLLERGAMRLDFDLSANWPRVRNLMGRYDRMDLADDSIVVMSEIYKRSQVLTVDRSGGLHADGDSAVVAEVIEVPKAKVVIMNASNRSRGKF